MWGQHQLLPHQQQPPQTQQQPPAPPTTQQNPQQNQQHSQIGVSKMVGPNSTSGAVGQWAPSTINSQGKDMPIQTHKSSGWEEPSPPTQRRNMPNFDDGTSLWGQQQQQPQVVSMQQTRVPHASGSHWKEEMTRTGLRNSVNAVQSSNSNIVGTSVPLTQARSGSNGKTDSLLWAHNSNINPARNPSWEENSPNWEEKNIAPSGNITSSWGETPNTTVWTQQQKQKHMIGSGPGNLGWPESESNDWGSNSHLSKSQSTKMAVMDKIRNSKQFRILFDMGFKKEDIELALHATLNLEEAIDILNQTRNNNSVEGWRRHDEQHNFEHNNYGQRFPNNQQASLAFVQVILISFH